MQKLLVGLCLLALSLNSAPLQAEQDPTLSCLDDKLPVAEAIAHCGKALGVSGQQDASLWERRAKLYLLQKQYLLALKDMNRAIELKPEKVNLYFLRGTLYRLAGQPERGEADIQRSKTMLQTQFNRPEHALLYLYRAKLRADQGQDLLALSDLNAAIRLDPQLAESYLLRGALLAEQQDYIRALKDYEQTIELNPKLIEAYRFKGQAHIEQEDYALAIQTFDLALKLDEDDTESLSQRAYAYSQRRQFVAMLLDLNKLLEIEPMHEEGLRLRAILFDELQQPGKAALDFSRLLQLNPGHPEALANRAENYIRDLQYSLALTDAHSLFENDPDSLEGHYLLVKVYLMTGQNKLSIESAERVIAKSPKDCTIFAYKAIAHRREWQYEQALFNLGKALELDCSNILIDRAFTYGLIGNWQAAEADIDQSSKLEPDYFSLWETSGWIDFLQAKPEQASEKFKKISFLILNTQGKVSADWLRLELPHLLSRFPGIENSSLMPAIHQDLELGRLGDREALLRVYENMTRMLKEWLEQGNEPLETARPPN